MRGGTLGSHLLASLFGGLALAGVLLAFGVIGQQRTETVPVPSSAPPTAAGAVGVPASDLAQIYDQNGPGVVLVRANVDHRLNRPFLRGRVTTGHMVTASGFLISRQGFVLTALHEVQGADPTRGITVQFNSQTTRPATLVSQDTADDIVLLKVSMDGVGPQFQALALGNSREVSVGESTLTLADPFGLDRTLATGVVSALQRRLVSVTGAAVDDVIQTDTATTPGADGGPLLDATGAVIGINSQIEVSSGSSRYRVSFAVPIDVARLIIPKGVLP